MGRQCEPGYDAEAAAFPEGDIEIVYTGLRDGEKMHEHLFGSDETGSRPVHDLVAHVAVPELRLSPEAAGRYVIVDYERYLPVAPGMVLIKAAGHTPGSQMVYVALESGREYLLIGDASWHMDGVREVKGKDAPWVTEDQDAVLAQLEWLNGLSRSEPGLVIVASHDEEQHADLVGRGLLGARLE